MTTKKTQDKPKITKKKPLIGYYKEFYTFMEWKSNNSSNYYLPLKEKSIWCVKEFVDEFWKDFRKQEEKIINKNKYINQNKVFGEYHSQKPFPIKELLQMYLNIDDEMSEVDALEEMKDDSEQLQKFRIIKSSFDWIEIIKLKIITSNVKLLEKYLDKTTQVNNKVIGKDTINITTQSLDNDETTNQILENFDALNK